MSDAEREERRKMFDDRIATQDERWPGYARWWNGFAKRMTDKAGELVVPPLFPEEHAQELEERGEFSTLMGTPIWGKTSHCHANAAHLWADGKVRGLATGYALSSDGLWRQHSWGIDASGRIVETTEERIAYFGFEMDDAECRDFCAENT